MRYPLFGVNQTGKSLTVSAQRRLNLYAEVNNAEDKTPIAFYPTPGLTLFADFGGQPVRGWRVVANRWFAVCGSNFYEVSSLGALTLRGTLSTSTGFVDLSDNGLQIIVVDGIAGYSFTLGTNTFATILDPQFPVGNTVIFDSGFAIANKAGTGEFYLSASYDVTSWDPLDFATAESSPDPLVRVYTDQGQLILFGESTTEFWGDTGATDFPYAPIGSATVEWGLVARWSVAKFNRSIVALMTNKLGQQQVVTLSGYTPVPISNPDLEYEIAQYSTVSDAVAFSYNLAGHPMYEINFPTAGKSWLYDGLTGLWSELESDGGRHWAQLGIIYDGTQYVSDYRNGNVYELTAQTYTDNGTEVARELVSRHVFQEGYQAISSVWVEMQPGVGNATSPGNTPVCMLQISRDGGFTYGPERWASMGALGQYRTRARWLRCGRARDFVFKFRVTDPVYTVFAGAYLDAA